MALLVLALTACSDDHVSQAIPTAPVPGAAQARGGNANNNGRIVFQSNRDGGFHEIYSMNADGTGVTRLTYSASADDGAPALSPDGKRVVFTSTRDDPDGEIYVMNADGAGVTRLTYSRGSDHSPVWSKDGKQIAFESTRDAADPLDNISIAIYVMNADGSQVTRVTQGPGLNMHPSWSADGKQIAFAGENANGGMDVYTVTLADKQFRRLTFFESPYFVYTSWSPGGKSIAFSMNQVFVVNVDDQAVTQLTWGGAGNNAPSWLDGGKKLVFTNRGYPGGPGQIYSMNADGSAVIRLTNNAADDDRPSGER